MQDAPEFAVALDVVLRCWTEGKDVSVAELLARFPGLAGEATAVLALAREIAVLRPTPLPTVPGYDVLEEIGRGGMGVVYRARQHGLGRIVALKVLPPGDSTTARSRFLAEARGLGRVRHANVVTIHEVVETADLVAYAMEWIDGRSLASLLEDRQDVPPAERTVDVPGFCRIGIAIARALGEMHRHGLVHRDVKPGNVLLRVCGNALLSDFGLVRSDDLAVTRSGQVLGTPAFAAPEQLRGDRDAIGPAADIYGLGATLHCMFAGRVPHGGRTPHELLAAIDGRRRRPLTAARLPRDLETIVARCLEPEPRDRYATADAVADDLENLLALRPVTARPLGLFARAVRMARRNRSLVAAAGATGVVVLSACVALGTWLWQWSTRGARAAEFVREARFALLEPAHEERVELADLGRDSDRVTAFATSGDRALVFYRHALALVPNEVELRLEQATVAAARQLLAKAPAPIPDELRAAAPMTAAMAEQWSNDPGVPADPTAATLRDRRLLGLLAFLTGHTGLCHDAWAPLELGGDPLVDAAAGQMHLQRGEVFAAYGLLARASQTWPDAGFLAISLADCAVRGGRLDVAEHELARAAALEHMNPFETDVRVRADLLAARGEDRAARDLYERLIATHVATTARQHYANLLARTGDLQRLIEIDLELAERHALPPERNLAVDSWRWWRSLDFAKRCASLDGGLWSIRAALDASSINATDPADSPTPSASASSSQIHQAKRGLRFLLEMTMQSNARPAPAGQVPSYFHHGLKRLLGAVTALDPTTAIGWMIANMLSLSRRCTTLWLAAAAMIPLEAQTVRWTQAAPPGAGPSPRSNHMLAIDPLGGDVLLYGGTDQITVFSDFWRWNGTSWSLISNSAPPGPRSAGAMVNLGPHDSVLLFGGGNSLTTYASGTWLWDGATWSLLPTISPVPSPRAALGMAYDALRDRGLLFAGSNGATYLADTWEFNPNTLSWSQVTTTNTPNSPSGRNWFGMAFDEDVGEVVIQGGRSSATNYLTDTWAFRASGPTWVNRTPTPTPTVSHYGPALAWDVNRQRVLEFGGRVGAGQWSNACWSWDGNGGAWLATPPAPTSAAPLARSFIPMIYHPARQCMIVFGGLNNSTGTPAIYSDTWTCTPDVPAIVEVTGPGCPSPTTSLTPTVARQAGSGPWVGSGSFALEATALPVAALNLLVLSLSDPGASIPQRPACVLHADPALGVVLWPLSAPKAAYLQPMPSLPGTTLLGLQIHAQTVSLGLAPNANPIEAVSNGLRFTIGTR